MPFRFQKRPQLSRYGQSDDAWRQQLFQYIKEARKAPGILIEYIYEPGRTVPQRLYRYDVFPDYVVRHRDDFEFGFDLIESCRALTKGRSYGVYIIELDGNPNHVYVGQTWYAPEERLRQHLTGYAVFHAAKPFKKGASGKLRPDLYAHLPRFRSQASAERLESEVAMQLTRAGFRVEGGH